MVTESTSMITRGGHDLTELSVIVDRVYTHVIFVTKMRTDVIPLYDMTIKL